MSWLSLCRRGGPLLRPDGGPAASGLDRGTLMLEFDLGELARGEGPLVTLSARSKNRHFSIAAGDDGRLHLRHLHANGAYRLSVGLGRAPLSGRVRLSYHWDVARGQSLLTSENLTRGTIRQQPAAGASGMDADEISLLFDPPDVPRVLHPSVEWLGLADHWQVIGPVPGLAPEVAIDTPHGPRPVSTLRPGDRVRTADDGDRLVIWQGRIQAPEIGSYRSVRLRAPYHGLARDIVLRATQPVAIGGAEVEHLFGADEVLAEAGHLVDFQTAAWDQSGLVASSHGIVLDCPGLIRTGGLWIESLYLAGIARNPGLARTTAPGVLTDFGHMPTHGIRRRRKLKEFEAQALVHARLARRAPIAV